MVIVFLLMAAPLRAYRLDFALYSSFLSSLGCNRLKAEAGAASIFFARRIAIFSGLPRPITKSNTCAVSRATVCPKRSNKEGRLAMELQSYGEGGANTKSPRR